MIFISGISKMVWWKFGQENIKNEGRKGAKQEEKHRPHILARSRAF